MKKYIEEELKRSKANLRDVTTFFESREWSEPLNANYLYKSFLQDIERYKAEVRIYRNILSFERMRQKRTRI